MTDRLRFVRRHRAGLAALVGVLAVTLSLVRIADQPAALSPPATQGASAQPNIVLLTIDTLRADHLGVYGAAANISPNIDAMAAQGVVFERAISQAPWTLPSMATVHTGLYPSQHGAVRAETKLDDGEFTIAEALQASGYRTLAVVSHTFVDRQRGFGQGFDDFDESMILSEADTTSPGITRVALKGLRANLTEPFFLWVHYLDPHFSYVRHPEHDFAGGYTGELPDQLDILFLRGLADEVGRPFLGPADLDYVRQVYDEEIAYTDQAVGELFDGLEALGLTRPTTYLLTADHGESFMEHGRLGHNEDVYQVLVHVPLLIAGGIDPQTRGRRVVQPVETRSLAATIAALAGLDADVFSGQDLLAVAAGDAGADFVFSQGSFAWGRHQRKIAVLRGDWKLIHNRAPGTHELYNLADDPAERINLWGADHPAQQPLARRLKKRLARFAKETKKSRETSAVTISDKQAEHLRALGYVQE